MYQLGTHLFNETFSAVVPFLPSVWTADHSNGRLVPGMQGGGPTEAI